MLVTSYDALCTEVGGDDRRVVLAGGGDADAENSDSRVGWCAKAVEKAEGSESGGPKLPVAPPPSMEKSIANGSTSAGIAGESGSGGFGGT